jgi:hypothetical protein
MSGSRRAFLCILVLIRERGKPAIASAKVRAAKVRLRKANKHGAREARPENERNSVNNFADMLVLLLLKPCILSVSLVPARMPSTDPRAVLQDSRPVVSGVEANHPFVACPIWARKRGQRLLVIVIMIIPIVLAMPTNE